MIYMKKAIAAMCSIIACASFMTSAVANAASEKLDQISKNMPEGTIILIGDLDGSEVVDVTDLTLYSLYLIGDVELEDSQKMCADTNMDSVLNICDLANFGAYCAKKVPEGSANMIGVRRGFSNKGIDRPTRPDNNEVPPTADNTGEADAQPSPTPTPEPTVTPTSTPATIDRPQIPDDYIWPINRENHTFDYATLSGKAYTKRCVHTFDESTLDEKTLNAFFESTVERTGLMASVKTVSGISSEEMFLLKCGNEEGKYYVFLNESLTEEEAKKIYDQFGITEYSTPEPATLTEPEQPIPTPVPTAVPNDESDYSKVERDPEAIENGFSGGREATEEQIAASKNQPDKD
jgi:hypothetical protein